MSAYPLHAAVRDGHLEEAQRLVQAGADLNEEDNWGDGPLHEAVRRNNLEVVEYLVGQGADIDKGNEDEERPLHLAALFPDRFEVLKYLVGQGADIEAANFCGQTPVHYAAKKGNICFVDYLKSFRGMPLDVSGRVDHGALIVECMKMDGETFNIIGLNLEQLGRELATRIQEEVPTIHGRHWKVMLPIGKILDDDTILLPLRELLGLECSSDPMTGGAQIAANAIASATEAPSPVLAHIFACLESGRAAVAAAKAAVQNESQQVAAAAELQAAGA